MANVRKHTKTLNWVGNYTEIVREFMYTFGIESETSQRFTKNWLQTVRVVCTDIRYKVID